MLTGDTANTNLADIDLITWGTRTEYTLGHDGRKPAQRNGRGGRGFSCSFKEISS